MCLMVKPVFCCPWYFILSLLKVRLYTVFFDFSIDIELVVSLLF